MDGTNRKNVNFFALFIILSLQSDMHMLYKVFFSGCKHNIKWKKNGSLDVD
jgi:hypothetical protein